MKRDDFNKLFPVNENFTAFMQTKKFMAENPVLAAGEKPLPEISEEQNLSPKDAAAELKELDNIERPRHGFMAWLETKIEQRKSDLNKMIAKSFMERKQADG